MSVSPGQSAPRVRRGSIIAMVLSVALIAVIVFFALRDDGFETEDVESHDGGVWVTNFAEGTVGRLNYPVQEIDGFTNVDAGSAFGVEQAGDDIFLTTERGIVPLDPRSVQLGSAVEATTGYTVDLGGDRLALASLDGRVWILTPEQIGSFRPDDVAPVLEDLGSGARVAVSETGDVAVLSRRGDLYVVERAEDTAEHEVGEPERLEDLGGVDGRELAMVGDDAVVLDREHGMLRTADGRAIDLAAAGLTDTAAATLQESGPTAERIAVADPTGISLVPLQGGDAIRLTAQGRGEPDRPLQVFGRVYGIWNGSGVYVRWDHGSDPSGVLSEPVEPITAASRLALRENHGLVVLNDMETGNAWVIGDRMQLVDTRGLESAVESEQ